MITFTGVDATGRIRTGILHTASNVGNWIMYQRRCNWRSLRVVDSGRLIGGIAYQRGSQRVATVWMSQATALQMKGRTRP